MTWRTETVGTLCDRFGGEVQTGPFGSQLHASDYQDEGTPVVMPQDLIDGRISTRSIAKVGQSHVLRMPQHVLRRGDIVFSRRGDVARFAIVNEREEGWICGTGCLRIRLNSHEVLSDYLRHFLSLSSTKAWLEHHSRGVTMANTNTSTLRELPLRYPSVDVQRRICSILDKADAIRRKRQEAIALTEQLLRSTFLEMFGDPVTNPKRWPIVDLRSHILGMDAGWSANGEPRLKQGDEWGVLKVSAVSSGWFRPEEHKAVAAVDDTSSLIVAKRGDLLFSRANTRELVAATCLVEQDESRLFLPDKLWRIRPAPGSLTPEYLRFVLSDPTIQAGIAKVATGTSGSMLNVSKEKVADLKLPLPPLERQREFVGLVWRILKMRNQATNAARETDTLFHSLVQRAFSGQL